ncbi:hypothetical protein LZ496_00215 [Sphingomonas sp. NSE70-1]|uniref:CHAD domain-containing protein n=1 Tax=Sphingomonas caseinilyticus TaxID=2908205 RepID=A0ABT0RRB8_9SPHN|nr:hypothetical protein [Sphingomonas caseinilyticus]MCL6697215.1 hypothetical protein [Sphingomonas caseinilyticus]
MDIIAAHQQGLIEKLAEEASALAGRPKDFGQRAVVLHHLYDHSRGAHHWALAEARRNLAIAEGLVRLRRRVARWGWLAARRERARLALEGLADALGEQSRERCAAAYTAYRSTGARSLREEAERNLPGALLDALTTCHAARRSGAVMASDDVGDLFDASQAFVAGGTASEAVEAAWLALDATGLRRAAHRLLGARAMSRALDRDRRRGWPKIEAALRRDPVLPASFRANPAQHFYALQNVVAERRRQQWREECDRDEDSFELAA